MEELLARGYAEESQARALVAVDRILVALVQIHHLLVLWYLVANKASFSPTTSLNVIGMVQQPHVASIALSHDEHSGKLALILRSYE